MHFVSCRHSTSGRTDLRNLATMSMRRRTELIFHVVRENRMRAVYYHGSRRRRPACPQVEFRKVGKGALATCPPSILDRDIHGGHAEPVIGRAFARPVGFAHPAEREGARFNSRG